MAMSTAECPPKTAQQRSLPQAPPRLCQATQPVSTAQPRPGPGPPPTTHTHTQGPQLPPGTSLVPVFWLSQAQYSMELTFLRHYFVTQY